MAANSLRTGLFNLNNSGSFSTRYPSTRNSANFSSRCFRASHEPLDDDKNKFYKELGMFSLRKRIEDSVLRAEMLGPTALELEVAKHVNQEEVIRDYDLWDDLGKSNEILTKLADSARVVDTLKDLKYKAEEARLITELAEMDTINYALFKQAYNASLDVNKLLDKYELSKLLKEPYDMEGACITLESRCGDVYSERWAAQLAAMYMKWAERQGHAGRIVERYASNNGGLKSATIELEFKFAYGYLSGERGVHSMIRSYDNTSDPPEVKTSTQPPAGLIQPLPIPTSVWADLTMDFITGLPPVKGFTVILVVVDRLTKYAHFGSLPTAFTAAKTAALFTEMVLKLHGFPQTIVSDRDPVFMSQFWQQLFTLSGTSLKHSSAYHPQTDGQTEVLNRVLQQYLRCYTQTTPTSWLRLLPWAEFSYNTNYHSSINMSPFQALYGRLPPTIPPYQPHSTSIQAVEEILLERDSLLRTLKSNLRNAQHRMTQQANKHRRDVQFDVGDLVWLRLQPYRQVSVRPHHSHKLSARYYGPFPIIQKIGPVAYKLDIPSSSRIHPVFHVSLLKPVRGPATPNTTPLPTLSQNTEPVSLPVAICGKRFLLRNGAPISQVLIQWSDSAPENSTWEDEDSFKLLFPNVGLEDKAVFPDGGDDTSPITTSVPTSPHNPPKPNNPLNPAHTITAKPHYPRRTRKPPVWQKDYVLGRTCYSNSNRSTPAHP